MGAFLVAPLAQLHVTSPFRAAEAFRARPHSGVDLRAAVGTEVYAPGPGRVISADAPEDADDAGGVEVRLLLDNGYRVGFAHLVDHAVSPGQRVDAGELVGWTGNTGHSTGPHLHLTLRDPSGDLVDPWPHLSSGMLGLLWTGAVALAGGLAWWLWRRSR